ncbi:MAG: hypothetical protein HY454_02235 [Parcubacteria group bacterium]|nr:hypothetical protein [Parcubacteria group bacterium]
MKKLSVFVLALLALAVFAKDLDACLCVEQTLKEKVKGADVVFTGKVREIIDLSQKTKTEIISGGDPTFAVIDILKSWKGIKKQRAVIVRTVRGGAACGVEFEVGEEYLVFANYDQAMDPLLSLEEGEGAEFHKSYCVFFKTYTCMGTSLSLENKLEELGKPTLVIK